LIFRYIERIAKSINRPVTAERDRSPNLKLTRFIDIDIIRLRARLVLREGSA